MHLTAFGLAVRCFFFWHGCAIKWIAVFVTRVVQVSGVHDVHLRPERRAKQPSIQSERRIRWTEVRSNSLERYREIQTILSYQVYVCFHKARNRFIRSTIHVAFLNESFNKAIPPKRCEQKKCIVHKFFV